MNIYRLIFTGLATLLLLTSLRGQVPESFQYQAVIRDDAGQIVAGEQVTIVLAIIKGSADGQAVFTETHNTQTGDYGLITLQVGAVNDLSVIDWSEDAFFLRVIADGVEMGTTQLMSVPYALHAQSSADSFSGDFTDLVNTPDLSGFIAVENPQAGDLLYYHDGHWQVIPIGEDGQALTMVEGLISWADLPEPDPGDDDDNGDDNGDDEPATVTDIDGNVYSVITIGQQQWMAQNLRTTRYADSTAITHAVTDSEWAGNTNGAYTIYPHDVVDGIDSEEEMVEKYGKLYNWHAVNHDQNICPTGWKMPDDDDWIELVNFIMADNEEVDEDNLGNVLKSCRQVNSPLGEDCYTFEHPRWSSHHTHYGTDDYGFNGLPAGVRYANGIFGAVGNNGQWWSSTEASDTQGRRRNMTFSSGAFGAFNQNKLIGLSIRCVKEE
ncbi:MAG: hypothetical protein EA361_06295 [Bacteroidetes bacterium]|nr:MAG: hypothetical protein EA361_06295 [Bacteroidota bacterium]